MARRKTDSTVAFGSDSFLDVIANTVGIMVILVMIAGIRAQQAPPRDDDAPLPPPADVTGDLAETFAIETEVQELEAEATLVRLSAAQRRAEREQLLAASLEVKELLARSRLELSQAEQTRLARATAAAESSQELERLEQELAAARATRPEVETLGNYPTPLSATVFGRELHFQLRDERVAWVPFDDIVDALRRELSRNADRLRSQSDLEERIGPFAGFRVRYALERLEVPVDVRSGQPGGVIVRVKQFTLEPVSEEQGEPIDAALAERSELRSRLAEFDPQRYNVTVWVYPESFAAFRKLNAEMHRLGYRCAARPLTRDQPIGGSPSGSRSAVQ